MPTIAVCGIEAFYREAGEGPPVILAHSSCSTGGQWKMLSEALAPRYRVLAPDLVGYGRTAPWPKGKAGLFEAEGAILLAMAELAGGRAHFVGHSYGGAMALRAAVREPAPFLSLALIEPPHFLTLKAEGEAQAYEEIDAAAHAVIAHAEEGDGMAAAERMLCYFAGRDLWESMGADRRAGVAQSVLKNAQELANDWAVPPVRMAEVARLSMPMLLMSFGRSPLAMRRMVDLLARARPDAERRHFPELGHMAPALQPERVNPAIVRFLDGVAGA